MNFELILVIVTAVTGMIYLVDKMVWKPKRLRSVVTEKEPIIIEYSRSLFPVFLIVLILRSFIMEPFKIPSGSMYPTLHIGDFIVVNKFAYGVKLPVTQTKIFPVGLPQRGDVVVFRFPQDPNVDYIKRVIGIPGDEVSYIGRTVFVNGKVFSQRLLGLFEGTNSGSVMTGAALVEETNLDQVIYQILLDKDKTSLDMNTVIVPEGYYFVLGDNRDHSNDSRFWGFVPERNMKGRAFGIWMSWDNGIQFDRIGKGI